MNIPKDFNIVDSLNVEFENGLGVKLPITRPKFRAWKGECVFDYGGKPLLDYNGEACFAELLIARLLIDNGLNAVWVETYGGIHYLRSMPKDWKLKTEHISIPQDKEDFLKKIWRQSKTTACFDVLAWDDENIILLEAKHLKKDNLTNPQIKFIKGAIDCGVDCNNLLIVEWDFEK